MSLIKFELELIAVDRHWMFFMHNWHFTALAFYLAKKFNVNISNTGPFNAAACNVHRVQQKLVGNKGKYGKTLNCVSNKVTTNWLVQN